jgi:putative nucleotidyltransferase with HDIG domain
MNLETILPKIDTLIPIPQIASEIMKMAQEPDINLEGITQLITYDAAITANILKTVNSAYFGVNRKIESVKEAVVLLGLHPVIQLVFMNLAAANQKKACRGYALEEGALWKHAAASAILSRRISRKIGAGNDTLIFTATLLKDIGKVVLSQFVEKAIDEINQLVFQKAYSFLEAEKEVIGVDHAQLGGIVAQKWNFSPRMAALIENHHLSDAKALDDPEACVIYLADTVCSLMGIGAGTDGLTYRFAEEALNRLDCTSRDVEEIIVHYTSEKEKINQLIAAF